MQIGERNFSSILRTTVLTQPHNSSEI